MAYRPYMLLILSGVASLIFVLVQMKVDVAVQASGKSIRGPGNLIVRSDIDSSIKSVNARDGMRVSEGTLLLALNDSDLEAEIGSLKNELKGTLATIETKRAILALQEKEHQSIKTLASTAIGATGFPDNPALESEKSSLIQEIRGAQAVLESKLVRLMTLEKEVKAVKSMVELGLEPAGELRKSELAYQTAQSDIVELKSKIALLQTQIRGLEPASDLRRSEMAVVVGRREIIEAETKASVLRSQIDRLQLKSKRYLIESPQRGTLLKLYKFNRGDSVKSGDAIAEIVPEEGNIIFEARINPSDITSVKEGNSALIALSSTNRYETSSFAGKVTYVSPASLLDNDGNPYFVAHIMPDQDGNIQAAITRLFDVGQVAEISIKSSERSVLAFLLNPLIRGSSKVFTEK
jgi:multidrug efflux pump subunit AcrA (membrane-fusion protein)